MPGPDEIKWSELQAFTGGLYERKTMRECPQDGLLEATDCYPQEKGGLAAFMRMEPVSHTGLTPNSLILGVWKLRPPFPQGRLRCATLTLDEGGSGIHTFRIMSMAVSSGPYNPGFADDLDAIRNGTWNEDFVKANVTVIDPSITMLAFRTTDAAGLGTVGMGYQTYFNLPIAETTGSSTMTTRTTAQGIYRLGASTASPESTVSSVSKLVVESTDAAHGGTPMWPSHVVGHQARMLYTATFNQLHNRIYMTSQGSDSPSTNFIDPLGERSGSITWMQPSQSDYLIVAKSQVGTLVAQGDMLNAIVRQASFSHNYMQSFPCATEQGAFFMVQDDACYMATQGGMQNITKNFYGTPMNPGLYKNDNGDTNLFNVANSDAIKLGQPTLAGDFLFAGNGYVMDMRTGAWFRSSFIPQAKNHTTDPSFFRVFSSENKIYDGSSSVINCGYFLENTDTTEATWNPSPSYSFSPALIWNPHQETRLRELVFHVDSYVPDSFINVEVFAQKGRGEEPVFEREYNIRTAGPQPVRCTGINANGDYVRFRATVRSDPKAPAPAEAPYLERVLVGSQGDTRTTKAMRRP